MEDWEGVIKYGPNVVSFTNTEGWKKWYIARSYVPPNEQPKVQQVYQSLA